MILYQQCNLKKGFFMAVEPVSGNKFFTSRAYTDNGNEYRRSNYGKIIGSGVGVAGGALVGYKGTKLVNQVMPIIKEYKIYETITQFMDGIGQANGRAALTEAEYIELPKQMFKYGSKLSKIVIGTLAVGTALAGLGIGAFGDSIANVVKRKKADKKVENSTPTTNNVDKTA